ncbi:NifB/NifX family molybdenum-iron cluster-binding protein [Papillibacter cinnamivorans]|uniref:Predicted Fe-Mo cluster-binding protein, NifX family n=1 Tax=Papillibacter cinnamivorans DSM 12816 TaxID=1122930 RepID=A0A1W1YEE6_9FIRM|nr:NifB/NifX family molybdenum-iron cluster-binding protein [Papillibacter cinnamivorans]SMC34504.1 Predicted Fe-Mo cluster-binding protein, NifX family [Papillibacter cinnamivorans DSM 12816]
MKIAIPVDENKPSTGVCVSFGRAPYFMIFDTVSGENVFMDNSAAASQGGAGIKAAQFIVDAGAEVLLTPRCGENAAQVLSAAGVRMYKTTAGSASDNVAAFRAGNLQPLLETHPGFHGHGR